MNRIFSAAFREAVDLVDQGIVSPEDVDVGMRLGYGWNAGPFEIADNAGLDTFVRIEQTMRALGVGHLVPSSNLIERMVVEGRLGRKAGKGFYRYAPEGKRLPWENKLPAQRRGFTPAAETSHFGAGTMRDFPVSANELPDKNVRPIGFLKSLR